MKNQNAAMPDDSAQDGQPEPDADDQSQGGGMGDMCVPIDALGQTDEQEQMHTPEVGDPVTMTVEGTISRISGGDAYVTPSAVNGTKMDDQSQQAPMDEESQLRQQAAGMGSNY